MTEEALGTTGRDPAAWMHAAAIKFEPASSSGRTEESAPMNRWNLWYRDEEFEAAFQAQQTSRRSTIWEVLCLIWTVGSFMDATMQCIDPDIYDWHLSAPVIYGGGLLWFGAFLGLRFMRKRLQHNHSFWRYGSELVWLGIFGNGVRFIVVKFYPHDATDLAIEDALYLAFVLLLRPFFMAWMEASWISNVALTLGSTLLIVAAPHASVILCSRLIIFLLYSGWIARAIYSNNRESFVREMQLRAAQLRGERVQAAHDHLGLHIGLDEGQVLLEEMDLRQRDMALSEGAAARQLKRVLIRRLKGIAAVCIATWSKNLERAVASREGATYTT